MIKKDVFVSIVNDGIEKMEGLGRPEGDMRIFWGFFIQTMGHIMNLLEVFIRLIMVGVEETVGLAGREV